MKKLSLTLDATGCGGGDLVVIVVVVVVVVVWGTTDGDEEVGGRGVDLGMVVVVA